MHDRPVAQAGEVGGGEVAGAAAQQPADDQSHLAVAQQAVIGAEGLREDGQHLLGETLAQPGMGGFAWRRGRVGDPGISISHRGRNPWRRPPIGDLQPHCTQKIDCETGV